MAYELTINRVMKLCAFEETVDRKVPRLRGKKLLTAFYVQMQDMFAHHLDASFKAMVDRAEGALEPVSFKGRQRELEVEIFEERGERQHRTEPQDSAEIEIVDERGKRQIQTVSLNPNEGAGTPTRRRRTDRLVGLFRSRRFRLKTERMIWDLRIRPSVTACALKGRGYTKLWWTFDGVPADAASEHRPSERDSVDFIRATSALAEVALPKLRDAYRDALEGDAASNAGHKYPELKFVDRNVRVSLADNNGLPFAKLVDAMSLRGADFADVLAGKYDDDSQKGAQELLQFIEDTSGHIPDARAVVLTPGDPSSAAIYCTIEVKDKSADGKITHVVAGLANSIDLLSSGLADSEDLRSINNRPALLRSLSAARPVSAMLANNSALQIEPPR